MLTAIFDKINRQANLTKQDAASLLAIPTGSGDYYRLLWLANRFARGQFGGRGIVFSQIGLDARACANPRDTGAATELRRGFSVADAQKLLQKAEWSTGK